MKRFAILAGVVVMTVAGPAWAEDFAQEVRQAKILTFKNGRAVKEADVEALKHITTLEVLEDKNKFVDECGKDVAPRIIPLDIGEKLKGARAVIVQDAACYGEEGSSMAVLDVGDRILWQDNAMSVAILSSSHQGVKDLAFGLAANMQSIWRWDATTHAYTHLETVEVPLAVEPNGGKSKS